MKRERDQESTFFALEQTKKIELLKAQADRLFSSTPLRPLVEQLTQPANGNGQNAYGRK